MSEYVNGAKLNINDTVRLDFQDQYAPNQFKDVASLVMNFETLKMVAQMLTKTVEDQELQLARLAEKIRKDN